MKLQSLLFLCVIFTTQASRQPSGSPFFEIQNGILVPTGRESKPLNARDSAAFIGRIVGGGDAELGSAPWMASLQWGTVRPSHFCGGVIINPNWVLTGKSEIES